jgi:hypothetical protein
VRGVVLFRPRDIRFVQGQDPSLVVAAKVDQAKVFDLALPLDQVAEGHRAMDERRAIKALLLP